MLKKLLGFIKSKAEAGRILWENDAPVFWGMIEELEDPDRTPDIESAFASTVRSKEWPPGDPTNYGDNAIAIITGKGEALIVGVTLCILPIGTPIKVVQEVAQAIGVKNLDCSDLQFESG